MIEVAAGLIFRDGKLLITQRHPEAHLGGLWEFPGGKLESGEDFQDCLRRELAEELGVKVQVGSLLCAVEHAYPEKKVRLKFYHCRLLGGKLEPLDCAALAWISRDELSGYIFPAADRQILGELQNREDLW